MAVSQKKVFLDRMAMRIKVKDPCELCVHRQGFFSMKSRTSVFLMAEKMHVVGCCKKRGCCARTPVSHNFRFFFSTCNGKNRSSFAYNACLLLFKWRLLFLKKEVVPSPIVEGGVCTAWVIIMQGSVHTKVTYNCVVYMRNAFLVSGRPQWYNVLILAKE